MDKYKLKITFEANEDDGTKAIDRLMDVLENFQDGSLYIRSIKPVAPEHNSAKLDISKLEELPPIVPLFPLKKKDKKKRKKRSKSKKHEEKLPIGIQLLQAFIDGVKKQNSNQQ